MNLFAAAGGMTAAVNPSTLATLRVSDGVQVNPDFSTTPLFTDIVVLIEVQALSTSDLQQIQNITQQSDMRAVYLTGSVKALNRPLSIGGDVLIFHNATWLVTQQLEEWGDGSWSKLVVTRQTAQPTQSP